jgi:ectoine hydroxylase-related dioxygenase (phytanoyl-CoA dioxygenase family)
VIEVEERSAAVEPLLTEAEVEQFERDGYLLIKGVLTREEAACCRDTILNMLPRDLSIPPEWTIYGGRIKPYLSGGSHTIDLPGLMFLYGNETLYRAAVQLLGCRELRVFDGSLAITLRNDAGDSVLSQPLHLDAMVPAGIDFTFEPDELQVGGAFYFTDVPAGGGGTHVVPGGHRRVEALCRKHGKGSRALFQNWKRIEDFPETVEVTGEAGDFLIHHHLLPHAACHSRLPRPRVVRFQRYIRVQNRHSMVRTPAADRFNADQRRGLSPLGAQLLGLQPWTE